MVLELTLKHVKALSTVLEQQQQKIIALQQDLQISKFSLKIDTAARGGSAMADVCLFVCLFGNKLTGKVRNGI